MDTLFPPALFQDDALRDRLVDVRRDIHKHPELGFEEVRTAGLVADRLAELDVATRTGVATTGVVGTLTGGKPGPCVLVRADMDALPLQEENDVPYRSSVDGKMHACGHDAHTSILLGAAEVLAARREDLAGTVKLVFQPAEEGPGGAEPMIAAGVMDDPKVDVAIGLHVWNNLHVGEVGILSGPAMAAVDMFDAHVTAVGGHGAAPHQTPDPIVTAAAVIQAWQTISSRETDPLEPLVLSVCMVQGGSASNIIPNRVTLRGTVRTYDDALRARIPEAMERILTKTAAAHGCGAELVWHPFYPATVNDHDVAQVMKAAARATGDHLRVADGHRPCMGGEDMSYFLRAAPGCFAFLGSAPADVERGPAHHSSLFDIDEGCLPRGVELLVRSVEHLLAREA